MRKYFVIKVKNLRFFSFLLFCFLSPFPHSPYACTALARQPTISAPNPLATRQNLGITENKIKGEVWIYSVPHFLFERNYLKIKVENLWFSAV